MLDFLKINNKFCICYWGRGKKGKGGGKRWQNREPSSYTSHVSRTFELGENKSRYHWIEKVIRREL